MTVVIARGTAEENNTRNFGNPVRPILPTSGELRTALISNFIKIHFSQYTSIQHINFITFLHDV